MTLGKMHIILRKINSVKKKFYVDTMVMSLKENLIKKLNFFFLLK